MNGKLTLFLDQYGLHWYATSAKNLREQIGRGRISAMYVDKVDGSRAKIGYVVGSHWCRAFQPVERAA